MTNAALFDRLCVLAGIPPYYMNAVHEPRDVPAVTRQAMLAALGYPCSDDGEVRASLTALEQRLFDTVPPIVVVREGDGHVRVPIVLGHTGEGESEASWSITTEDGGRQTGQAYPVADDVLVSDLPLPRGFLRRSILIPIGAIPCGYHRLTLVLPGGAQGETCLLVAPRRCYRPAVLEGEGKRWGLAVQLYSIRSRRNWGVGDFTDLMAVVRRAAALGAAAVGLNPLHALFPEEEAGISPYSPNSRLFLNPIYLDLEAIAEFDGNLQARALIDSDDFRERLARARESDLIDYAGVWRCKAPVLALLFDAFRHRHLRYESDPRSQAFHDFCHAGGKELERFAVFQVLREHAVAMGWGTDWRHWPDGLGDPDAEAVATFAGAHTDAVEFQRYLQWQAETQLEAARTAARRLGLSIGLYHDLAVGADPRGAEAWSSQAFTVRGISLGSPPDAWNPRGQDWGLVAPDPLALRAQAYAPFARMLRANMRRGGALRIDHILGLMRLFWVPHGTATADGGYIHYVLDELLAVIALESQRSHCLVIGEDLGTVPEGLDEALIAAGILTYRLLYFEQTEDIEAAPPGPTHPSPADRYPRESLVAVGTHDLPTLPAYWQAEDLRLRDRLGLWPNAMLREREYARRESDRAGLLHVLHDEGLLADDEPRDVPITALHAHLGSTPCRLLMVCPPDLHDWLGQHNLPGTDRQYPNWQQRLPEPIEDWGDDERLLAIGEALGRERGDRWGIARHHAVRARAILSGIERAPCATYRLQLNADFTLDDASRLIPYLARLGISHLYLSPWLSARHGSLHGYDVVDHGTVNPELGGRAALDNCVAELDAHGLGQILDFVPNHMGVGSDNPMWADVLEWGRESPYARAFDIDWSAPDARLRGRVLIPVLGDQPEALVARGEIGLRFDPAAGRFSLHYGDHAFPLAPAAYAEVLQAAAESMADEVEAIPELAALRVIAPDFRTAPRSPSGERRAAFMRERAALATLCLRLPRLAALLCGFADQFAARQSAGLSRILGQQPYRLAFWRDESESLNYRRFFNISSLIGVRPEDTAVFDEMHRGLRELWVRGKLDGVRLDHIDGLFDPAAYCVSLVRFAQQQGARPMIFVEKILGQGEALRSDWPIDGSTGYEFLGMVNGLFVDPENAEAMTGIYRRFAGTSADYAAVLAEAKRQAMHHLLKPELLSLARELTDLAKRLPGAPATSLADAAEGVAALAAGLSIYRTYVSHYGAAAEDRHEIDAAVTRARSATEPQSWPVVAFIAALLRAESADPSGGALHFTRRFQQFTGPVMAKAGEDMAFYRYHRLVSLNEVGAAPENFGISVQAFHRFNLARCGRWSRAMLATATHDTKRGEDARPRIDVLSELPKLWSAEVTAWAAAARALKSEVDGRPAPASEDEYLLYQTLLGAWPIDLDPGDPEARRTFLQRMGEFMTKALREGRRRSSWTDPNAAYERAVADFLDRLLDPVRGVPFLERFLPFQERVARLGMLSSLVQLALKCTCPGFPDFYQGSELLDLALVDPDNRRAVDFASRLEMLDGLDRWREGDRDGVAGMRESWRDGRIKMHVMRRLLGARRDDPDLFEWGDYTALAVTGPGARHLVAFARSYRNRLLVVIAGRFFADLIEGEAALPAAARWKDTRVTISLPGGAVLDDVLTGAAVQATEEGILVGVALATLPVAVLMA